MSEHFEMLDIIALYK